MTRMSIDVPTEFHQAIKLHATFNHQTIRDFVVSALEGVIRKKEKRSEVNAETKQAFLESDQNIGITYYDSVDDLFKKFGYVKN